MVAISRQREGYAGLQRDQREIGSLAKTCVDTVLSLEMSKVCGHRMRGREHPNASEDRCLVVVGDD